jgi:uncharacterized membrane protein
MQNPSGGKTALGLDLNVGGLLTYLPVCGISLIYSIIVLITDKQNKIVRFHAVQSLLLIAMLVVLWIAVMIISIVLAFISSTLSALFSLVVWIVLLGFLGLAIFMCIKAYGLEMTKLPIIGDMADKWSN